MNMDYFVLLAKNIDCEFELGIWIEMEYFFEQHQSAVQEYSLQYEDNRFNVKVKMVDFKQTKEIFHALVSFIEYDETYYIQEHNNDEIIYKMLSIMEAKKGFLCQITFVKA